MRRDYLDPIYKAFRTEVLKRDHFSCQFPDCGRKSQLEVHHIKTWKECPSLRTDVDNGITLCSYHHRKVSGVEKRYAPLFLAIIWENKL